MTNSMPIELILPTVKYAIIFKFNLAILVSMFINFKNTFLLNFTSNSYLLYFVLSTIVLLYLKEKYHLYLIS